LEVTVLASTTTSTRAFEKQTEKASATTSTREVQIPKALLFRTISSTRAVQTSEVLASATTSNKAVEIQTEKLQYYYKYKGGLNTSTTSSTRLV
jgi:hypothetical protein